MFLIVLGKFRKKPTKERIIQVRKETDAALERLGAKRIGSYFAIGRYDYVSIFERPKETFNPAQTIRRAIEVSDDMASETLVAVNDDEVLDLL